MNRPLRVSTLAVLLLSFAGAQMTDGALLSIRSMTGGGLGDPYCMTEPNSTGVSGVLTAAGSAAIADNDVTLMAASLPLNAFGFFFLSSTPGFIPSPNTSSGNFCLSGDVGLYRTPGDIKNSGATGSFSLAIDLVDIPQPTGSVSVMSGETWYFQAWHRDFDAGALTSNFTNGLEITFN